MAYWAIIASELLVGILCNRRMAHCLGAGAPRARVQTHQGCRDRRSLGRLRLYFFGFLVVGGEWFQMWQSGTWNGQEGAFRFAVSFALVPIFVAMEDHDPMTVTDIGDIEVPRMPLEATERIVAVGTPAMCISWT